MRKTTLDEENPKKLMIYASCFEVFLCAKFRHASNIENISSTLLIFIVLCIRVSGKDLHSSCIN